MAVGGSKVWLVGHCNGYPNENLEKNGRDWWVSDRDSQPSLFMFGTLFCSCNMCLSIRTNTKRKLMYVVHRLDWDHITKCKQALHKSFLSSSGRLKSSFIAQFRDKISVSFLTSMNFGGLPAGKDPERLSMTELYPRGKASVRFRA